MEFSRLYFQRHIEAVLNRGWQPSPEDLATYLATVPIPPTIRECIIAAMLGRKTRKRGRPREQVSLEGLRFRNMAARNFRHEHWERKEREERDAYNAALEKVADEFGVSTSKLKRWLSASNAALKKPPN